jgi:hypothetical protein
MPTSNKGLNQPALSSAAWGPPLNDNASIIDKALGAFVTISDTSGTVNLTLSQCQNMCIKSTTSALTANLTLVVPSGVAGQWVFVNQSAPSAFSIIVKNAASATSVSIPIGKTKSVYSDGSSVLFADTEIDISTQAQAEAKTDNTTAMSPLRTAQQITSSLSSQAQAEAGSDNTTLMTPLRVAQAVTTGRVLNATALANTGEVGTYAWLGVPFATTINAGQLVAGGNLRYAGTLSSTVYSDNTAAAVSGTTPAGTWRAMGSANNQARIATTMWLRIS